MTPTKHKNDCGRVFNRYDLTCDRCRELAAGSQPREGWGARRKRFEAAQLAAIRTHDCRAARCGPVCTFGDW